MEKRSIAEAISGAVINWLCEKPAGDGGREERRRQGTRDRGGEERGVNVRSHVDRNWFSPVWSGEYQEYFSATFQIVVGVFSSPSLPLCPFLPFFFSSPPLLTSPLQLLWFFHCLFLSSLPPCVLLLPTSVSFHPSSTTLNSSSIFHLLCHLSPFPFSLPPVFYQDKQLPLLSPSLPSFLFRHVLP